MTTKLDQLKSAFDATTPGDWRFTPTFSSIIYYSAEEHKLKPIADFGRIDNPESDAEFIALAHKMMPDLLEAVELLKDFVYDCEDLKALWTRGETLLKKFED